MSNLVLESAEPPFDKSDRLPEISARREFSSLPEPPRGRRQVSLGSLLVVSFLSFGLAYLLLPEARFALSGSKPADVGDLATAVLDDRHSDWIEGEALTDSQAVAFQRRGTQGSFRLAPLKNRPDFWVLLHAPTLKSSESYVPPRHFSGRLLQVDGAGLKEAPLISLIKDEARKRQAQATFVLLEGESPRSQRDSLLAAILFALLGMSCFGFALRLGSYSRPGGATPAS